MDEAERTIAIRRPLEQVFRFLSDGRTATQWRAGELAILAVEPDGRVDFRSTAGEVRVIGTFVLEAMGDATILTCSLRGEPAGWRGLLFPGAVRSALAGELASLDRLQDLLER